MNSLPFHPAIVHLPLALGLILPLFSTVVLMLIGRASLPRHSFALVLGLEFITVGSGFMAMQSGEEDEERAEELVEERYIHEHEEAAERFVWTSAAAFVLAAIALAVRLPVAPWLMGGTVALQLIAAYFAFDTGQRGGQLVYVHGAANAHLSPAKSLPNTPH